MEPRALHYSAEVKALSAAISNQMLKEMHDLDWARYLAEVVYCLWIHTLCCVIERRRYSEWAGELISFTKKLLYAIHQKLSPPLRETELVYRRLFSICGQYGFTEHLKELYNQLNTHKNTDVNKVTLSAYNEALVTCKE